MDWKFLLTHFAINSNKKCKSLKLYIAKQMSFIFLKTCLFLNSNLVSRLSSRRFACTLLLALTTVPGLWFRKGLQFKTVQVKQPIEAIVIITANHLPILSSSAITDGYRWPITAASFSCLVWHRVFWAHCPLCCRHWSRKTTFRSGSGKISLKKTSLALGTFCSQKLLSGKILSTNKVFSVQMTKSMYFSTALQKSCNWT